MELIVLTIEFEMNFVLMMHGRVRFQCVQICAIFNQLQTIRWIRCFEWHFWNRTLYRNIPIK